MGYWALVNKKNIVESVFFSDGESFPDIEIPETFRCIQTSYTGRIRKNFASIGYKYDQKRDAFIAPKPGSDYLLNEETCRWYLKESSKSNDIINNYGTYKNPA